MSSKYYATVGAVRFWEEANAGNLNVDLLFTMIGEDSPETLRYSLDNLLFIIKTNSDEAQAYLQARATELDIPYVQYTYEEMLAEIQNENWTPQIELPI